MFNGDGTNKLSSATTDAAGNYQFSQLDPGSYRVAFSRPTGKRFSPQNTTTDDLDSDPDPGTGWVAVSTSGSDNLNRVDVGFYGNAGPVAVADSYKGHVSTNVTGNVLGNDTDANDDKLHAENVTFTTHGTLYFFSTGNFTYVPNPGWTGTDTFTYKAKDDFDGESSASVTFVISNTPAPTATDDTYSAPNGITVDANAGVLANDIYQGTGTVVAVLESATTHGTLDLKPDGSFSYVPDDFYTGSDSFTYYPTDGDGPGGLATVTLQTTDHPPTTVDDTALVSEDGSVTLAVLGNDSDQDGDTLTVSGASDGIYGTTLVNSNGTITYTPYTNFNGIDQFVYVLIDNFGRYAYGVATITVSAVSDPPDAVDDAATTNEDTAVVVSVLANDTDPENDVLIIASVTPAWFGLTSIEGSTIRYTPMANFHGSDSFSYTISAGNGGTDTAWVSVAINSVNDLPIAVADSAVAAPNYSTPLFSIFIVVLDNDSDIDGDRV